MLAPYWADLHLFMCIRELRFRLTPELPSILHLAAAGNLHVNSQAHRQYFRWKRGLLSLTWMPARSFPQTRRPTFPDDASG